ncbi:MAG: YchJ family metal-binding protein, partial [Chloroflexota bacterium]
MARLAPGAPCPCGSGRAYKACCRPYHQGKNPPTPEALMRARYSAYAAGEVRFV